ncbi:hypothetical protein [Thalassotalea marina]|nr:hypothetical protein [Thalassotalea marina]
MEIQGNKVVVNATGPWNIEFTDVLHRLLAENVAKVAHDKYGIFLSIHGEAVAGEDVVQAHQNFVQHGNATAVAVILEHCETTAISRMLFGRVYSACNINHAFFDTEKEGMKWLDEQLA